MASTYRRRATLSLETRASDVDVTKHLTLILKFFSARFIFAPEMFCSRSAWVASELHLGEIKATNSTCCIIQTDIFSPLIIALESCKILVVTTSTL